jgi:predicted transcriptional regulator
MTIREIQRLLDARLICGEDRLDDQVYAAFGADLMSDVLAFVRDNTILLTGLVNHHVIRTAEMLDVFCVLFVRGKDIPDDLIALAKELGVTILSTKETLYTSSGKLYGAGLPGCERRE